ncbi:nuclear transport factor 2 family protein [Microbispora sp. H10885]|uniref:nuclear transport factor 2 family protein n=1 Tax=Microbispora sp. H10885 TaxID=2729110 RepID=UPI00217603AD|nr:nuclear transport factor 2 family protein [Microbispora sp. H10885]
MARDALLRDVEHGGRVGGRRDPEPCLGRPRSPRSGRARRRRQAVGRIRQARPDLRFTIGAVLGDGDLVAIAGTAGQGTASTRLIWLVRVEDGLLAEMWTYRDTSVVS